LNPRRRAVSIRGGERDPRAVKCVSRRKDQERLCEAEFQVYLGRVAAPEVRRRVDERYEVIAGATPSDNGARVASVVIRLRGNDAVIADILRKGNWGLLLELLK
jgi:hypothetical protein